MLKRLLKKRRHLFKRATTETKRRTKTSEMNSLIPTKKWSLLLRPSKPSGRSAKSREKSPTTEVRRLSKRSVTSSSTLIKIWKELYSKFR